VPAAHAVYAAEPAALQLPAGVGTQDIELVPPGVPRYVPAGHVAAVAFVEPATQKKPGSQGPSHVAAALFVDEPKVPAGHGVGAPDATAQNWPAPHGRHEDGTVYVAPPSEYAPAGQGNCVAEAVPDGQ
jgi:hypothetical protein